MNLKKLNLEVYKKQIIIICACLIAVLFFGGIYLVHASSNPKEEVKDTIVTSDEKEPEVTTNNLDCKEEYVLVDIKGAVLNPGVYRLTLGSSVQDAINIAGGLAEGANTNVINLSKHVFDEMVIIIYTNDQVAQSQKTETTTEFVYVELPCDCPDNMNDACIEKPTIENSNESVDTPEDTKISINTATKEELMQISGIGESKAIAIVAYRDEHGEFKNIEDIKNVSGIGDSLFEKIKTQITV